MEEFNNWLENEASRDMNLASLLKNTKSEIPIVALFYKFWLFILFISRETKPKNFREEPTADITRGIIKDMNSQNLTLPPLSSEQEAEGKNIPTSPTETSAPQQTSIEKPGVKSNEMSAVPRTTEPQSASGVNTRIDQSHVTEVFLESMKNAMKLREKNITKDLERLRFQERAVFWGLVITAGIALVTIAIGISLIYREKLTVGVVVGAAGIIPGTGTVIFNRLSKDISERIKQLSKSSDDSIKLLQAIQITLLIPDANQRNLAMNSLAEKLRDRAINSV